MLMGLISVPKKWTRRKRKRSTKTKTQTGTKSMVIVAGDVIVVAFEGD